MKRLIEQYLLIKSDRTAEIVVKTLLACSAVIVACEIYILQKL
jgi:hypothetical protein